MLVTFDPLSTWLAGRNEVSVKGRADQLTAGVRPYFFHVDIDCNSCPALNMAASMSRTFARTTFTFTRAVYAAKCVAQTSFKRSFSLSRCVAARFYTDKHEWISVDSLVGTVGISNYAQEQLGEIVYVETPEVGTKLQASDVAGCLESVKAASEVFNPVGGTVTEVNKKLTEEPSLVNSSPLNEGWLYKLNLDPDTKTDSLMTEEAYEKYVGTLDSH